MVQRLELSCLYEFINDLVGEIGFSGLTPAHNRGHHVLDMRDDGIPLDVSRNPCLMKIEYPFLQKSVHVMHLKCCMVAKAIHFRCITMRFWEVKSIPDLVTMKKVQGTDSTDLSQAR